MTADTGNGVTGNGVLDRPRFHIEAGKMAELAVALHAPHDLLPPTYTVAAAHQSAAGRSPNEVIIAAAGLDPARVLLGAVEWTHHRAPVLGTTLYGEVRLSDVRTKRSRRAGTLSVARGEVRWTDEDGAPVVEVRSTLLEPARAPEPSFEATAQDHGAPPAGETLTLSRTDIVRYAGASGDFNPVHHDHSVARAKGYPDVFAMGLLPGGILAARLASVGGAPIRHLSIAFRGIVWPDTPYRVEIAADPTRGTSATAALRDRAGTTLVEVAAAHETDPTGGDR